MTAYRHRQNSIPALLSLVVVPLLFLFLWFRSPEAWPVMMVVLLFATVILVLFSSLTVEVSDGELAWHFGPNFWRNRLALSDIVNIETTHLPWWYGSGIKWTREGWMYLVSGGPAIKLRLKDGSVIRIGTNDPHGLAAVLAASK